jgi:hypothetical protein
MEKQMCEREMFEMRVIQVQVMLMLMEMVMATLQLQSFVLSVFLLAQWLENH